MGTFKLMRYIQRHEAPGSEICDFCGAEDSSLHFFLVCPALVRPRAALLQVMRTGWPVAALLRVVRTGLPGAALLQVDRTGWPRAALLQVVKTGQPHVTLLRELGLASG